VSLVQGRGVESPNFKKFLFRHGKRAGCFLLMTMKAHNFRCYAGVIFVIARLQKSLFSDFMRNGSADYLIDGGDLLDEKAAQSLIAFRCPEDLVVNPRAAWKGENFLSEGSF
jgi:hypothetical protein